MVLLGSASRVIVLPVNVFMKICKGTVYLGIKISYEPFNDIDTHLIKNPDHNLDIALIPNPQGVVNLGQRGIALPIVNYLDS